MSGLCFHNTVMLNGHANKAQVLLLLTLAAVALQRESYNFNLKRRPVLYLFPASIRPSALTLELYSFPYSLRDVLAPHD